VLLVLDRPLDTFELRERVNVYHRCAHNKIGVLASEAI